MSYLLVGSEEADKFYAECAIDAGVAFVNALPVFIASDLEWAEEFEDAGVPIVGDYIKSQVGATITHACWRSCSRTAAWRSTAPTSSTSAATWTSRTCSSASAWVEEGLQDPGRHVQPQGELADKISDRNVHIGPSDYVAWLDDLKWAYVASRVARSATSR